MVLLVSSHREMISFRAANAVSHLRVFHPFLFLNKSSSMKWLHHYRLLTWLILDMSVRFGHFSSPESMPFLQIPGLSPGVVVQ